MLLLWRRLGCPSFQLLITVSTRVLFLQSTSRWIHTRPGPADALLELRATATVTAIKPGRALADEGPRRLVHLTRNLHLQTDNHLPLHPFPLHLPHPIPRVDRCVVVRATAIVLPLTIVTLILPIPNTTAAAAATATVPTSDLPRVTSHSELPTPPAYSLSLLPQAQRLIRVVGLLDIPATAVTAVATRDSLPASPPQSDPFSRAPTTSFPQSCSATMTAE